MFNVFNISIICKQLNDRVDSLVVSATSLLPHQDSEDDIYEIQLVYRPSIMDNYEHWKVLNDDTHIIIFLETKEGFDDMYFEGGENVPNESFLMKIWIQINK